MSFLYVAFVLAVLTAMGHSFLSEKLFLRPLRLEAPGSAVFLSERAKRLATAMFHAASLFWVTMAISMLILEPDGDGYRATLHLFAAAFALSGLGNFWGVGKPHPGGVMLLATSFLVLASLYM